MGEVDGTESGPKDGLHVRNKERCDDAADVPGITPAEGEVNDLAANGSGSRFGEKALRVDAGEERDVLGLVLVLEEENAGGVVGDDALKNGARAL
jgi:hypothetical protein